MSNITQIELTANGTYGPGSTPEVNPGTGGLMAFFVEGTFDGATVKLQHRINNSWYTGGSPGYVDVGTDTTLTAAGGGLFVSPFSELAVNVASAGGSTNVKVVIKPVIL